MVPIDLSCTTSYIGCQLLFKDAPFSHNTYVTDRLTDRRTDATPLHKRDR